MDKKRIWKHCQNKNIRKGNKKIIMKNHKIRSNTLVNKMKYHEVQTIKTSNKSIMNMIMNKMNKTIVNMKIMKKNQLIETQRI